MTIKVTANKDLTEEQIARLIDEHVNQGHGIHLHTERMRLEPLVPESPSAITEWFDVTDPSHLTAWKLFIQDGSWPRGFIPEGMEFPAGWNNFLAFKIAKRLCNMQ